MFKRHTVIVLGAAVSAEVGLPLGWALKSKIADMLPKDSGAGDDNVRFGLLSGAPLSDIQQRIGACREILRALPKAASIDNLVEHRGADEAFKLCAKVGIIAAILAGERKSRLYVEESKIGQGNIDAEGSSYADLFRILVGNAARSQLSEAISRVAFVNFNYDRCLEHYLYDWMIGYSGLPSSQAAELVNSLKILRPYGTIAPLPMLARGARHVRFGSNLVGLELQELASNILTFSEERRSETDYAVRELMANASQIVMLGCAFHRQNLELLKPETAKFTHAYGTCYHPPPMDESSVGLPTLETYAEPTRRSFEETFQRWARDPSLPTPQVTFEPLTAKHFIAKHAPLWAA